MRRLTVIQQMGEVYKKKKKTAKWMKDLIQGWKSAQELDAAAAFYASQHLRAGRRFYSGGERR